MVLRTDTTPARLQEMPPSDQLPKEVLNNALALVLAGLVTTNGAAIVASDSVLVALGKAQAQLNAQAAIHPFLLIGA